MVPEHQIEIPFPVVPAPIEFFRHMNSVESTEFVKYFCKKVRGLEPTTSHFRDRHDSTEP